MYTLHYAIYKCKRVRKCRHSVTILVDCSVIACRLNGNFWWSHIINSVKWWGSMYCSIPMCWNVLVPVYFPLVTFCTSSHSWILYVELHVFSITIIRCKSCNVHKSLHLSCKYVHWFKTYMKWAWWWLVMTETCSSI
jgi:hypothetical protein